MDSGLAWRVAVKKRLCDGVFHDKFIFSGRRRSHSVTIGLRVGMFEEPDTVFATVPSGAGKTTLLHVIGGDEGSVMVRSETMGNVVAP